jgi:low temperature requirement protein LtrA
VLGYVVMRIALVTQWLRVPRDDTERRRTAQRYALGVTACQIVWGVAAGGLLILFSIWWLYFDRPAEHLLTTTRAAFVWGYGHLLDFASIAAVGAGLSLAIESASHPIALSPAETGAAIAIPVAVFLLSLWAFHVRAMDLPIRTFGAPVTEVIVVAASFTVAPPLIIGLVLTLYVAAKVVARLRADGEILT